MKKWVPYLTLVLRSDVALRRAVPEEKGSGDTKLTWGDLGVWLRGASLSGDLAGHVNNV